METVKADCSGCMEPFRVNVETGQVTMTVPSNGKRGAQHAPAHDVTAEAVLDSDGALLTWECPRCGYAESIYPDPKVRKALAGW